MYSRPALYRLQPCATAMPFRHLISFLILVLSIFFCVDIPSVWQALIPTSLRRIASMCSRVLCCLSSFRHVHISMYLQIFSWSLFCRLRSLVCMFDSVQLTLLLHRSFSRFLGKHTSRTFNVLPCYRYASQVRVLPGLRHGILVIDLSIIPLGASSR